MRLHRAVPVLLLPLLLLAACGEEAAPTAQDTAPSTSPAPEDEQTTEAPPTETSTAPGRPACDEVWVEGETFPERYRGCDDAAGELVQAESSYCEFGTRLFYYDDAYYAVPNGPVNRTDGPLAKDESFRTALAKCGG